MEADANLAATVNCRRCHESGMSYLVGSTRQAHTLVACSRGGNKSAKQSITMPCNLPTGPLTRIVQRTLKLPTTRVERECTSHCLRRWLSQYQEAVVLAQVLPLMARIGHRASHMLQINYNAKKNAAAAGHACESDRDCHEGSWYASPSKSDTTCWAMHAPGIDAQAAQANCKRTRLAVRRNWAMRYVSMRSSRNTDHRKHNASRWAPLANHCFISNQHNSSGTTLCGVAECTTEDAL